MRVNYFIFLLGAAVLICFLFTGCASTRKDWESAQAINAIETYKSFVKNHPKSEFTVVAVDSIQTIEWKNTKAKNTAEGYQTYIKNYPLSRWSAASNDSLASKEYTKAMSSPGDAIKWAFIKKWPNSKHSNILRNYIVSKAEATFNLYIETLKSQGAELAEAAVDGAPEDGKSEAQNSISGGYYHGNGLEKDFAEAVKWGRKAAAYGHPDASKNLSSMGHTLTMCGGGKSVSPFFMGGIRLNGDGMMDVSSNDVIPFVGEMIFFEHKYNPATESVGDVVVLRNGWTADQVRTTCAFTKVPLVEITETKWQIGTGFIEFKNGKLYAASKKL